MEPKHESIFASGIRAFFKAFAAVFGILIAIGVLAIIFIYSAGPSISPKGTELTILPDAEGNHTLLPETAPIILQIAINGVIGTGELTATTIEQILLDSREGFLKNDRVKAILLEMNTPGGTVDDSDAIYRALLAYKAKFNTPIYAYVNGICASGGIYICAAADKIFASPTSIIGSVGVIMGPFFNLSKTMDKIGIDSLTISTGKEKDFLNPFRPWQPGEGSGLKAINESLYARFVSIVTAARPNLDKEKLIHEYGAGVYLADKAEQLGYIDRAGVNYEVALKELTSAANISETTAYQVAELHLPHNLFTDLTGGKSPLITGKLSHQLPWNTPSMEQELSGKFLYLYQY